MAKRGRKATYPWGRWLDGGRHVLRQGEDFACRPKSLISRARSHAHYHGIKVRTRTLGRGSVVEIRRIVEAE